MPIKMAEACTGVLILVFGIVSAIVGVFFLKNVTGPLGMFLNACSYGLWYILDYLWLKAMEKKYKVSFFPTGEDAKNMWMYPIVGLIPYLGFYLFALQVVQ